MENRPRMTSSRKGDIAASSYRQQPALLIDPFRQAASYVDRILRGENPPTFRCRRRPTAPRTNSMIEESATSGYGTFLPFAALHHHGSCWR